MREVDERVVRLPERPRTAFYCLCAEALLPLYQRFHSATGWGRVEPLREALDAAWRHVDTGCVCAAEVDELMGVLLALAPDDEDWDGKGRDAQDAVICVGTALRSAGRGEATDVADYVLDPLIASLDTEPRPGSLPPGADVAWQARLMVAPPMVAALSHMGKLVEQLPAMDVTAEAALAIPGREAAR